MTARLSGKRIAFLATNGVEQVEFTTPWQAVKAEGATPELIATDPGQIYGMHHDDKGDMFTVGRTTGQASADD